MKVTIDVRVLEEWAQREYGSTLGQPVLSVTPTGDEKYDKEAAARFPPFVRQIRLDEKDPRLADLKARLNRDEKKRPGIRGAVLVERIYTRDELAAAELFRLLFTAMFEPCGVDMGTEYDETHACPKCGVGRVQCSVLRLDLSAIPKNADIATTIAGDEWIVSDRLAELMARHQISGYNLRKVEHRSRRSFTRAWHQLIVTGSAGCTAGPTRFGIDYFTGDPQGIYECDEHSLSGLHVLSEVHVSRHKLDNVDLAVTSNRTGMRSGVVVPAPLLLISPRMYHLLQRHRIGGFNVEVAHIVDSVRG